MQPARKPRVYGFTGKIGVGKKTLCNFKTKSGGFHMRFDKPLQTAVKALYNLDDDDFLDINYYTKEHPRWGTTTFALMNQERARYTQLDRKFFIGNLVTRISELMQEHPDGVEIYISDVSSEEEVEVLRSVFNAKIIRVEREKQPKLIGIKSHIGEAGVSDVDYVIQNNGDINHLREMLDDVRTESFDNISRKEVEMTRRLCFNNIRSGYLLQITNDLLSNKLIKNDKETLDALQEAFKNLIDAIECLVNDNFRQSFLN